MYYNPYTCDKYKYAHVSPLRHVGARVGPRGFATWPWVPRRIHVGPAKKLIPFLLLFYCFNWFKIENKFRKIQKNP